MARVVLGDSSRPRRSCRRPFETYVSSSFRVRLQRSPARPARHAHCFLSRWHHEYSWPRGHSSSQASIEQLFSLSISNLEIRGGRCFGNEQTIPLHFDARNLALSMDYSFLHARYSGRLLIGMVDTKLLDCRPFAWMASADFSINTTLPRYLLFDGTQASNLTADAKSETFDIHIFRPRTMPISILRKPLPLLVAANSRRGCRN